MAHSGHHQAHDGGDSVATEAEEVTKEEQQGSGAHADP